jgi:hypothetical protein
MFPRFFDGRNYAVSSHPCQYLYAGNFRNRNSFRNWSDIDSYVWKAPLSSVLIQASLSVFIAGQMGESSLAAGVKHACVLLLITLVLFNFLLV